MESWDRDAETQPPNRCRGCGAHVTAEYRRTYGNESGTVYACPSCATYREMKDDGAAIATDGGQSDE